MVSKLHYPLIVKPSDRSGSRGITKIECPSELGPALEAAWDVSFAGTALIEEFLKGDEFSVECISWKGEHTILQVTRKFTTGAPGFIETGHIEPPLLSEEAIVHVKEVVSHALTTLGVWQGAAHAEVKMDADGRVGIVEIGSRMGGDFIGSDLVPLSTGIDFIGDVVDCALGFAPDLVTHAQPKAAAVRFVLNAEDAATL
ncbi:MAG: ATP-grasp domain-containing protein, partial [Atopobiaceae bacterium]|nr:ATP-grasp domain-containing protein [Atopobiaceae bacterium]